jgi:hypothetical protein
MTMTRNLIGMVLGAVAVALVGQSAVVQAQATPTTLGTVRLSRAVVADGKALPAGSYTLRVSEDSVTSVVGQGPDNAKWVEFVQAGQVKGRELSSVLLPADVKAAVKGGTPPAANGVKVELLKSGEYLRVWANRGGRHYLIHLSVG